jgi:hypothetical protein
MVLKKVVVPADKTNNIIVFVNTEGVIKNGQSRETGNIAHTRPRKT